MQKSLCVFFGAETNWYRNTLTNNNCRIIFNVFFTFSLLICKGLPPILVNGLHIIPIKGSFIWAIYAAFNKCISCVTCFQNTHAHCRCYIKTHLPPGTILFSVGV